MVCVSGEKTGPVYEAFRVLYLWFVVLPILAGLDKIFQISGVWNAYLAPDFTALLPFTENVFLMILGIIEVIVGIIVAIKPRIGSRIIIVWLLLVTVNLALIGASVLDKIFLELGLVVAAVALARLSVHFCR